MADAVPLKLQALDRLERAHQRSIVHRDLSHLVRSGRLVRGILELIARPHGRERSDEVGVGGDVSFRYYLYISDSKVDMLLPQIDPGFAAGRRSEVSVNLRVFGAKRTIEPGRGTDRIARLERVVRHLQDHGDLGSVDESGQFFGGLLPMRWGQLPGRSDGSLVFFGGRTDRTVLGLGGSARHLIGSAPDAARTGESRLPTLLDGLAASELEDECVLDAMDDEFDATDRAALATVRRAVDRMPGPAQNVEFVAKRLLHGPSPVPGDDRSVLLGSPVYVALFD